uniref:Suppressor of IKBKE 1 n=1 Tax=Accipiter nisus TaxID=211598 RepID=A0A8B9MUI2_9AVES
APPRPAPPRPAPPAAGPGRRWRPLLRQAAPRARPERRRSAGPRLRTGGARAAAGSGEGRAQARAGSRLPAPGDGDGGGGGGGEVRAPPARSCAAGHGASAAAEVRSAARLGARHDLHHREDPDGREDAAGAAEGARHRRRVAHRPVRRPAPAGGRHARGGRGVGREELWISLEEHQDALELIMSKYRKQMLQLLQGRKGEDAEPVLKVHQANALHTGCNSYHRGR